MNMNRDIRRLQNSKNTNIAEGSKKSVMAHAPAVSNMADGEQVFAQEANRPLALYKKNKGSLWKSYFSNNGNQIVDRTLIADELKFTRKFTDYKIFLHNFSLDLGTTETFIPWVGIKPYASNFVATESSILAPYKMTLQKLMIRPTTIDAGDNDLRIRLYRMDNADTTVYTIASAIWDVSDAAYVDHASGRLIAFKESDFDNSPTYKYGDKGAISMLFAGDVTNSATVWNITSVWKTEILI